MPFVGGQNNPSFAQEVAIRAFEPSRPYPQQPQAIVYRTRFMQLRAYYTRPAQNVPHPDLPQVYFADDIDFQDRLNGMVEWTRVYTTLPNGWTNYNSESYTYPGFQAATSFLGRNPTSFIVTANVKNEYFMVGSVPAFDNILAGFDDVGGASWTNRNLTYNGNAANIPVCAGSNAAASLLGDTGGAGCHFTFQATALGSIGQPAAIFVRRNTANMARVAVCPNGATVEADISLAYATVDLTTGNIVDAINCVPRVSAVGDGFWRVVVEKVNYPVSNAGLALCIADDNGNVNYTTGATPKSLWAWRGQIPNSTNYGTIPSATIAPTTYAGAGNIPVTFRTLFNYSWSGGNTGAGFAAIAEYLSDGGFGLIPTVPTKTNYLGWVTNDNANSASYSIEATDSQLNLWYGMIWERQRKFVKAI